MEGSRDGVYGQREDGTTGREGREMDSRMREGTGRG